MSSDWKSATVGNVPTTWAIGELRDFLELITYGFTNPMPDAESGPWKLTAKDVVDGRINYGTARRTTPNAFNKLTNKSRPRLGDILLTKDGSIGRVAVVDRDGVCINQSVALLRPNKLVIPDFLKYLLLSPHYQQVMEGDSDGSTIKHIYITRVDKMQVAVPPIPVQEEIIQIVGSLDSRISLLRETNVTLEAIAHAMFKSWFVDFDPVRAKQDGRVPELMSSANAALFPNTFEESALGAIPGGWRAAKLGSVCSYISRGISPKYCESGGILVINQKCIRGFSVDYSKARRHDSVQKKIDGKKIALGDVLVNSTGVGTLGRVAQILELPELAIVDSHVTVVRAGEELNWTYLGQVIMQKQSEIEAMGEGSTGQTELSRSQLADIMLVVPPQPILALFDQLIVPLKSRISVNENIMGKLAQLRDTLLPRLISGQLRLTEAVEMVDQLKTGT
jgi:type I restriction enzyme S subunit